MAKRSQQSVPARQKPSREPEVLSLYYITHINNIRSILTEGILSHSLIEQRQIQFTPIYDTAIVSRRRERLVQGDKSLWDFANMYFQPRNPMLYRVLHEKNSEDIAVLGISPSVLQTSGALVSLGNAAAGETQILPSDEGRKELETIWKDVKNEWWSAADGSKRRIMAECLVPDMVDPECVNTVYVSGQTAAARVRAMGLPRRVSVVPEPSMFFRPARRIRVTETLFLADGDMFFSTMQTLTVSVNTVGIMGKGLASRAKYQFPDVYVRYQDVCRQKLLSMGRPYLYKRESFFDLELAEDPASMPTPNERKWFLLFATKRHWRDRSELSAIDTGLHWISDNFKKEGIQSLALPALGCGLGRLDWKDVGPVMCRTLATLEIPTVIYLPREADIDAALLTTEFLLEGSHQGQHRII